MLIWTNYLNCALFLLLFASFIILTSSSDFFIWFQSIVWLHQLRIGMKLGCDNSIYFNRYIRLKPNQDLYYFNEELIYKNLHSVLIWTNYLNCALFLCPFALPCTSSSLFLFAVWASFFPFSWGSFLSLSSNQTFFDIQNILILQQSWDLVVVNIFGQILIRVSSGFENN